MGVSCKPEHGKWRGNGSAFPGHALGDNHPERHRGVRVGGDLGRGPSTVAPITNELCLPGGVTGHWLAPDALGGIDLNCAPPTADVLNQRCPTLWLSWAPLEEELSWGHM